MASQGQWLVLRARHRQCVTAASWTREARTSLTRLRDRKVAQVPTEDIGYWAVVSSPEEDRVA